MDGWDCSIPVGLVSDKVVPELRSREAGGHYDRTPRKERGQKGSKKSVHMEKRHDQKRSIIRSQFVSELNIFCTI